MLNPLPRREHVDVRTYSIIYDAINDVKKALEGLLEPTYRGTFPWKGAGDSGL